MLISYNICNDMMQNAVTAADGAEASYTLANNETRTESAEFARVVNQFLFD
jgi:hypothetical protein